MTTASDHASRREVPTSPRVIERYASDELIHAGAGTSMFLGMSFVLIIGWLPSLALLGVIAAVAVLPAMAIGLAGAILATPPFLVWRLVTRKRRARGKTEASAAFN